MYIYLCRAQEQQQYSVGSRQNSQFFRANAGALTFRLRAGIIIIACVQPPAPPTQNIMHLRNCSHTKHAIRIAYTRSCSTRESFPSFATPRRRRASARFVSNYTARSQEICRFRDNGREKKKKNHLRCCHASCFDVANTS